MAESTNIAWATSTFNPWIGCTKVSPGCEHCYASVSTPARALGVTWGAGQPRRLTSKANWKKPIAWNAQAAKSGKPWRVFCSSLADVFDNEVPGEWRRDLFELIRVTPHLTWMLLTKRIGNVEEMLPGGWYAGSTYPNGPWPNVWIGATVVNQEEADRDIPKLLKVPAAVRFLSIEPMLGPIDLRLEDVPGVMLSPRGTGLSWVIVGGESDQQGMKARPFDVAWARSIVAQCKAANVPVFVKQLGSAPRGWCAWNAVQHIGLEEAKRLRAAGDDGECVNCEAHEQLEHCECNAPRCVMLTDRAGADPDEWPFDLRVREFPT